MSSLNALKLAVAVAALVATGSAAQAQSKASLWEGVYIGVNAGAEFGKYNFIATDINNPRGIIGGVHGGYNWQAGSMVYGIELDADFSGAKKSADYRTGGVNVNLQTSNPFLGTIRGRLGYASGATMFYATSGLAYGTAKVEASARAAGIAASGSTSDTHAGYAVGLGAEYAFSSSMSLRVEGLHYGFKDVFKDSLGAGGKFDANVIRAGLSYKF
jgi:outer membrane immunogenic protein